MDSDGTVRPLTAGDLDGAVALDARIVGRRRRGYFEKRLAAARRQPDQHLQYGVDIDGKLAGMVLCHLLTGEFGQRDQAVMLEVVDVAPDARNHGVGQQLIDGLEQAMRRRRIGALQTEIDWTDTDLAHFFAAAGFRKGPWHVIDCNVAASLKAERRAAAAVADDTVDSEAGEPDYSGDAVDDLPTLARDRIEVRSLDADDLDRIVRIDRNVIGEAREGYMRAKLDEALNDSAIRVSLIGEIDGQPAGFLMARIDFGDFGRTEPVAVLDTIDVGPEWAQHGVATALLSQLLVNLSALQVEQLETTVGRDNFDLLRFLYHHGFEPSQRIALVKTVH